MTKEQIAEKIEKLKRMTVANGATPDEEKTAKRIIRQLTSWTKPNQEEDSPNEQQHLSAEKTMELARMLNRIAAMVQVNPHLGSKKDDSHMVRFKVAKMLADLGCLLDDYLKGIDYRERYRVCYACSRRFE